MARLHTCSSCGAYVRPTTACPTCGTASFGVGARSAAAVLLGLALTGCPPSDKDDTSGDTATTVVALYGVEATDDDGDGYPSVDSGGDDCNDTNPAIHPDATETAGDGVDSNCDGDDDT
jgi:hypothetical protein